MKEEYKHQDGRTIRTVHPSSVVQAIIFDEEQRATINRLMSHGFLPHHSSVGKGRSGKKHWTLSKYKGRYGRGFLMCTTSPYSSNFNHLTYFLTA